MLIQIDHCTLADETLKCTGRPFKDNAWLVAPPLKDIANPPMKCLQYTKISFPILAGFADFMTVKDANSCRPEHQNGSP
ncbi:hypothetical protein DPMN_131054 [Dreissena polymorpha]|uniref:Uncharacterized protein n=1 Tax=Dreissena polymorpha TaxID=45954 RepID=A0A9D4H3X7_DREPO|nr:hypothetical protein DPMN_131054 [Dreissena polymorpha]